MSFYRDRILPHLIHMTMRQPLLAGPRQRVVSAAEGRVLELGIGSGLNVPHYGERVSLVIGLDPSPKMLALAKQSFSAHQTTGARQAVGAQQTVGARQATSVQEAASARNRACDFVSLARASAEDIPLDDHSIDTVVTTWTLCTIPDVAQALGEARRILKPSGRLLFIEHGQSPDAGIARWQDRLTPLWRRAFGGCHLNRRIDRLIEDAGFQIERIETAYLEGPRLLTFMYEGSARPR